MSLHATTTTAKILTPTNLSYNNNIPPHLREYQLLMRDSFFAIATPLNILLFLLFVATLYFRLRPTPPPTLPSGAAPTVFRTFTPRTLLPFNGVKSTSNPEAKVLMGVKGKVYDVSGGRNFYGPGGPYENFAGRDATRGLACQSFDEEMLTKNLDGPLDACEDLSTEQIENLNGWVERFDEKYLIVGKLIAFKETVFH